MSILEIFFIYLNDTNWQMKVMHKQHVRWIWGFVANRSAFMRKKPNYKACKEYVAGLARFEFNLALAPIVTYIIFTFVAFILEFALFLSSFYFNPSVSAWLFLHSLVPFSSLYFLFIILVIFVIAIDQKHMKLSFGLILASIFLFAFYFLDFIPAFFDGVFDKSKRKTWAPIEHVGKIINENAKNQNEIS